MPPSKDTCSLCNSAFYGRQKFLKCAGPCGLRYHLDCLKLGEVEYDIFMEGGSSSYKCVKCVSASKAVHGDNTPIKASNNSDKKIISPSRELNLPDLETRESLSVQLETVRLNSVSILDTLCLVLDHVKIIEKEMVDLKNENAALKIQMAEMAVILDRNSYLPKAVDSKVGHQQVVANSVKKSYSSVVSDTARIGTSVSAIPAVSIPLSQQQVHMPGKEVISPTVRCDEGTSTMSNTDPEGFQIVTKKKFKKREPKVGTCTNTKLEMAPERIRSKALFVSRFSSNVNKNNIEESLLNQLKLRSLSVTKLKTKFQSYSSFHISVDERDFDLINNTDVWPAGCLIAPFFGKLKPEQHFAPSANSDAADSRVNAS